MSDIDDAIAQAPPAFQVMHPVREDFCPCETPHDAATMAKKWAAENPGMFVPIYRHETSVRAQPKPEITDAHG